MLVVDVVENVIDSEAEQIDITITAGASTSVSSEELVFGSINEALAYLALVNIDDDVITKTSYIYNMVDCKKLQIRETKFQKEVTYIGSLIREKGFHVLAKAWKDVLKEVPDAKLNVIGSGKLYNRGSQLGKYGIADKEYEESWENWKNECVEQDHEYEEYKLEEYCWSVIEIALSFRVMDLAEQWGHPPKWRKS